MLLVDDGTFRRSVHFTGFMYTYMPLLIEAKNCLYMQVKYVFSDAMPICVSFISSEEQQKFENGADPVSHCQLHHFPQK